MERRSTRTASRVRGALWTLLMVLAATPSVAGSWARPAHASSAPAKVSVRIQCLKPWENADFNSNVTELLKRADEPRVPERRVPEPGTPTSNWAFPRYVHLHLFWRDQAGGPCHAFPNNPARIGDDGIVYSKDSLQPYSFDEGATYYGYLSDEALAAADAERRVNGAPIAGPNGPGGPPVPFPFELRTGTHHGDAPVVEVRRSRSDGPFDVRIYSSFPWWIALLRTLESAFDRNTVAPTTPILMTRLQIVADNKFGTDLKWWTLVGSDCGLRSCPARLLKFDDKTGVIDPIDPRISIEVLESLSVAHLREKLSLRSETANRYKLLPDGDRVVIERNATVLLPRGPLVSMGHVLAGVEVRFFSIRKPIHWLAEKSGVHADRERDAVVTWSGDLGQAASAFATWRRANPSADVSAARAEWDRDRRKFASDGDLYGDLVGIGVGRAIDPSADAPSVDRWPKGVRASEKLESYCYATTWAKVTLSGLRSAFELSADFPTNPSATDKSKVQDHVNRFCSAWTPESWLLTPESARSEALDYAYQALLEVCMRLASDGPWR